MIVTGIEGIELYANAKGLATRRLGTECLPFPPEQQIEVRRARGQPDWSVEQVDATVDDLSQAELSGAVDCLDGDGRLAALRDRLLRSDAIVASVPCRNAAFCCRSGPRFATRSLRGYSCRTARHRAAMRPTRPGGMRHACRHRDVVGAIEPPSRARRAHDVRVNAARRIGNDAFVRRQDSAVDAAMSRSLTHVGVAVDRRLRSTHHASPRKSSEPRPRRRTFWPGWRTMMWVSSNRPADHFASRFPHTGSGTSRLPRWHGRSVIGGAPSTRSTRRSSNTFTSTGSSPTGRFSGSSTAISMPRGTCSTTCETGACSRSSAQHAVGAA